MIQNPSLPRRGSLYTGSQAQANARVWLTVSLRVSVSPRLGLEKNMKDLTAAVFLF